MCIRDSPPTHQIPFRAFHLFTDGSAPGKGDRSTRAAWAIVAVGAASDNVFAFLGWTGGAILDTDCGTLG
eukprot:12157455-Alexandrium_andersonii.AAC.1